MICHGSKEYRPDVSKRPRIIFGFAERGSLLHTMVSLCHQLTKPWSSLAGVLLMMRGSFLQGDERIIRSGSRGRPLASKVSIERRWPHQRGTDLTCRSIWDAGVSGFIISARSCVQTITYRNSIASTELFSNQYDGSMASLSWLVAAKQLVKFHAYIYSSKLWIYQKKIKTQ